MLDIVILSGIVCVFIFVVYIWNVVVDTLQLQKILNVWCKESNETPTQKDAYKFIGDVYQKVVGIEKALAQKQPDLPVIPKQGSPYILVNNDVLVNLDNVSCFFVSKIEKRILVFNKQNKKILGFDMNNWDEIKQLVQCHTKG